MFRSSLAFRDTCVTFFIVSKFLCLCLGFDHYSISIAFLVIVHHNDVDSPLFAY